MRQHLTNLTCTRQTVGEHMVLLGALFRDESFQGLAEERLVPACTGSNQVQKKA